MSTEGEGTGRPFSNYLDVLVVGAGLSGIGAACHLRRSCPKKSFAIVEARSESGGTWSLFRYPGLRSDSDMFTLGYGFKPWRGEKSIADGQSILAYIRETARENGIEELIHYNRRARRARWSEEEASWTVELEDTTSGALETLRCGFLYTNAGYYRYDEGYLPDFPHMSEFGGTLVHPQHWPAELALDGAEVVVIGSGATAVTLVPAIAEKAAHVTMLQRSPSYIAALPSVDPLVERIRRRLPPALAYRLIRLKNVWLSMTFYQMSRRRPERIRALLRRGVASALPEGYEVDLHFKPRYDPWDQRLCVAPDGDLFRAISQGKVSVVTDTIESFSKEGIVLTSGAELTADVVITATGLNMQLVGGMELYFGDERIDLSRSVGYKGVMFSGVPNLAATMGYTNASWTLKADLAASYVCRLLNHMSSHGYKSCTPTLPAGPPETAPFIDLSSGYVTRSLDMLPRQGTKTPWRLHQNYPRDLITLGHGRIDDGLMVFSRIGARREEEALSSS